MRISWRAWLSLICLTLLMWHVASADPRNGRSNVRRFHDAQYSLTFPAEWRVVETSHFDSISYTVSDHGHDLFFVDFGINPNIAPPGTTSRAATINGMTATEFRKDSVLSDTVVEPPCGGAWFIWMHVISKDVKDAKPIADAVKSITCLVSPRPTTIPRPHIRLPSPGASAASRVVLPLYADLGEEKAPNYVSHGTYQ